MEGSFESYLASEAGQALQAEAMGLIDLSSVETQLQSAIGAYMNQVMGTLSTKLATQVGGALQSQISAQLEGAMSQLTTQMSDAANTLKAKGSD